MDAFKNYISPEETTIPFAEMMAEFPKTEEDWVSFGARCLRIALAIFAMTCMWAFSTKRNKNSVLSKRNVNFSIAVGLISTYVISTYVISSKADNDGRGSYSFLFGFSGFVSCIVFAVIVSLSVWCRMLEVCAIIFFWGVGTALLLFSLYVATMDADGSKWGKLVSESLKKILNI